MTGVQTCALPISDCDAVQRVVVGAAVEAGENHFTLVHGGVELSVAIHIGVDDEVRRHRDEDLVVDDADAHRRVEERLLHEDPRLVRRAIAIGVLEHNDAVAGGLAGMLFSTWLTTLAEKAWPIAVGNMPIVAWWPNLIVIFEMTMLGAIVTSVVTLIITAGLARRVPALYDPEVTNGKILVGIAAPRDGSAADVERALLAGRGAELKTA